LLAQLERASATFAAAGVRAVAVGMASGAESARFCAARARSITCLGDPSKAAYSAYGLRRGSLNEVMGPQAIAAGMRATLGGHMQGARSGDPMMMPGTFAIDRGGVLRAVHYARHSGDQPDLEAMLAALRAAPSA
jgi:peroxiredoxin